MAENVPKGEYPIRRRLRPAGGEEHIEDRGGSVGGAEAARRQEHHIGPSDYVAWQNDCKVCDLRMEGRVFGRRVDFVRKLGYISDT